MKKMISTIKAPNAIGCYSQAIQCVDVVYISGQIPLDPHTMQLVPGGIEAQIIQVLKNLQAITQAAGGDLKNLVRITVYLQNIGHLAMVNAVMPNYFTHPYPARTSFAVSALPKDALVEIDAIMHL